MEAVGDAHRVCAVVFVRDLNRRRLVGEDRKMVVGDAAGIFFFLDDSEGTVLFDVLLPLPLQRVDAAGRVLSLSDSVGLVEFVLGRADQKVVGWVAAIERLLRDCCEDAVLLP